jgi:O-antigen/teichoic acid export membrane protein
VVRILQCRSEKHLLPDGSSRLVRRLTRSEFVQHGALIFVSTMLASAFLYVFYFVASRWLGVERYGTLSALLSSILLLSVLSTIGMTIAARLAAELSVVQDVGKLRRLSDVLLRWSGGIVVIAFALGVALRSPISAFLHVEQHGLIELSSLTAGLGIALTILRGVFQGSQKFGLFAGSMVVEAIGKTLFGIIGLALGAGLVGAISGFLLGSIFALVWTYVSLRLAFRTKPDRLRVNLSRLVITSGGIAGATLGITTLTFFDVVLAKHYLDAHWAGLYGAASLTGRALLTVVSFLPTILLPKATTRAASGKSAARLLLQAAGAAVAISAAVLAVYSSAPWLIIRIFAGPAFADAAVLVLPLGAAAALLAAANVVITYKIGLHRFDFVIPMLLVVLGELIAIVRFHGTPFEIIRTLLIGHALVLAASLYNVTAPALPARPDEGQREPRMALPDQS